MKTLKKPALIMALITFTIIDAKAQQETYRFEYIYKMQIETPRGRTSTLDYYLPANGDYFAVKNNGILQVFDNNLNKMYSYMGFDSDDADRKTLMAMKFDFKELLKLANDEEDPRIYKSVGYASILGHDCELYRMTSDTMTSEVWVAKGLIEGSFGENAGHPVVYYMLSRSSNVGDDSLEPVYSGLPLKIVTKKKRGSREKITTMTCIKFDRSSLTVNTNEYRRLF
ncbi:DUF4412 domain-containing protein [Flagellimonas sp. S174]|uniref:DUF4412 domain-containing protein n=1 Tax=Flagellimonas sp. S174 TaxID=3410790 RepID=UPI003BF5E73C